MATKSPPQTDPNNKIIIVAGQEFMAPLGTDDEAIRGQLVAQGFADVASAKIEKGVKQIGEIHYTTVEFVKKAGTKGAGLGGAELAELLARVPRGTCDDAPGLTRAQAALIRGLIEHRLTVGQMLADLKPIAEALQQTREPESGTSEGEKLCASIDRAQPAACAIPLGW